MKQRIIFNLFSLAMIFLVAVACQKDYESMFDPTSEKVMTSDVKSSMKSYSARISCNECPHGPEPVCGDDGQVYRNACFAECAGVYVVPCLGDNDPCLCPNHDFNPVCGSNGETYDNACEAECAGVYVVPCLGDNDPCLCPHGFNPVCGDDGMIYDNACEAECAGVYLVLCDPCLCPGGAGGPVCGDDGMTYGSACEAECAGTTVVGRGDCIK